MISNIKHFVFDDSNKDKNNFKFAKAELENFRPIIFKDFIKQTTSNNVKDEMISFAKLNQENNNYFDFETNFVTLNSGVSKLQKTLHLYRSINFNKVLNNDPKMNTSFIVFRKMLDFYNLFVETKYEFNKIVKNHKIIPQCMQFMSGGGFLATHVHKYLPQKIGLILNLTNTKKDEIDSSIQFDSNSTIIDTYSDFMQGDLLVFNYKQPHWVTPCNINQPICNNKGLFIMTLPLIEINI